MPHPTCRACKGDWDRRRKCRACGGSGVNTDLWEQRCKNCYATFIVKSSGPFPDFCKDCRNKTTSVRCSQDGCYNTTEVKLAYSGTPAYCKSCYGKRKNGWSAGRCKDCSGLVWSPPGKTFETCQSCSNRRRTAEAAKWKEKSCPGLKGEGYCGKTIKYRIDWDRAPDICPDCREKAKRAKVERDAKMREKPCAGGCGRTIRYSIDWEHPPSFCKECKEKRSSGKSGLHRSVDTTDLNYVMPGIRETIGQLGGTRGKHYPRQGKVHCIIFEGMGGNDIHYSWDVDFDGNVVGRIYGHPNNPRG